MKRTELEHIIRAAGSIAGDDGIPVIGSQAILAQFPEAPDELLRSIVQFPIKRKAFWSFEIEIWDLFGICDL